MKIKRYVTWELVKRGWCPACGKDTQAFVERSGLPGIPSQHCPVCGSYFVINYLEDAEDIITCTDTFTFPLDLPLMKENFYNRHIDTPEEIEEKRKKRIEEETADYIEYYNKAKICEGGLTRHTAKFYTKQMLLCDVDMSNEKVKEIIVECEKFLALPELYG